jgi:hypothetical protein
MKYYTSVLPGFYEFRSDIKELLQAFKNQIDNLLKKIDDADKKAGG